MNGIKTTLLMVTLTLMKNKNRMSCLKPVLTHVQTRILLHKAALARFSL